MSVATTRAPSAQSAPERVPLVSVIVPAFNEAAGLGDNLRRISSHLDAMFPRFRFEMIVVDDGSSDRTGAVADEFAAARSDVRVAHHPHNGGLGKALRTGFEISRGDAVVVLDADLSYAPEHVDAMLEALARTSSQVVTASPYAAGGEVRNVPRLRKLFSVWANRYLGAAAGGGLTTVTGMVRAYDGPWIRSLALRSDGMAVNCEIIAEAVRRGACVAEVPACLDWGVPAGLGAVRRSSMRFVRHTVEVLGAGVSLALLRVRRALTKRIAR